MVSLTRGISYSLEARDAAQTSSRFRGSRAAFFYHLPEDFDLCSPSQLDFTSLCILMLLLVVTAAHMHG